jgi:hypothetical protein
VISPPYWGSLGRALIPQWVCSELWHCSASWLLCNQSAEGFFNSNFDYQLLVIDTLRALFHLVLLFPFAVLLDVCLPLGDYFRAFIQESYRTHTKMFTYTGFCIPFSNNKPLTINCPLKFAERISKVFRENKVKTKILNLKARQILLGLKIKVSNRFDAQLDDHSVPVMQYRSLKVEEPFRARPSESHDSCNRVDGL